LVSLVDLADAGDLFWIFTLGTALVTNNEGQAHKTLSGYSLPLVLGKVVDDSTKS
jgi:hypothetical protein